MKHLLLVLVVCLGLTGCDIEPVYAQNTQAVQFCDDQGYCRWIAAPYYYDNTGSLFYWDAHFGCWIGRGGYWRGGVFYNGFHPQYHNWYNGGGHYYHGGGGWHGGAHFHGGGGGHFGGHGGHR